MYVFRKYFSSMKYQKKVFEIRKMSLLSKTEYKLTKYAAETMVYFERHNLIEIAKKILVECSLQRPLEPQEWIGRNIKRIANEIYQDCLSGGKKGIIKSLKLSTNFLPRIVVFGRPGSGRKTQAYNLISTFNLVLIDAEMLIYQHLRGNDDNPYNIFDRELQRAFHHENCSAKSRALLDIIMRRVLEKDCLSRGWILLNATHTLQDFKAIFEGFDIPPNKLIYLNCSERTCLRRLTNMPCLDKPSQNFAYYEQEMRFFNHHQTEVSDYLFKRQETTCVNAEDLSENVKTQLINSIIKSPCVMGFKQHVRL